MKKCALFIGVLVSFFMLSCNNTSKEKMTPENTVKNEKTIPENTVINEKEKVTTQATTNVPSYVRVGWNVIKREYTDVKTCTAYSVDMVEEQMYNDALHNFYVVIYEVRADDLSSGAKCLAVSFCPDFDYAGITSLYWYGTLEENKKALEGEIVNVNLN